MQSLAVLECEYCAIDLARRTKIRQLRRIAKHIAIVLPDFRMGGVEKISLSLAKEFVKKGYVVEFIVLRKKGELLDEAMQVAKVVNLGLPRFRSVPVAFAKYLKTEEPDAILVSMWPLTVACLMGHRLARSKARIVVSDHNNLPVQYTGKGVLHAAALRASLALTYPLADARVGVSGGVVDGLVSLSGLSRQRFTVVHNPISAPDLSGSTEAAEKAWQGWRGKRIITVGRLKAVKNHALLIRSFKRLLKETEARLMILGTGDLEAQTREFIAEEGLSDKILMPGHVLDPDPFYISADLFVLSSDCEGFGNVIVEALACGLPVVSTRSQGPAEILQEGRYGTLVPVGDEQALARAMVNALNTRPDHDALKRRAADFSPDIAAEKYLDLLLRDRDKI